MVNKKLLDKLLFGIFLCMVIGANLVYAAEVDNAAVYYSKAFDLQKYNEKMKTIKINGNWPAYFKNTS